MLNWVLATIAATLWSTAYSWYFLPDLRRWLWRRRRRQEAEAQRAQAQAAWMRRGARTRGRPAPPPSQPGPHDGPRAGARPTAPRHPDAEPGATVIQFPPRRPDRTRRS